MIAPGIDATDVGEAFVAYQWASRMSRRHDLTVLTHRKRSRQSAIGQLPHAEVIEWDEPPLIGRAERFNSLMKPWYPYFHARCRRWIHRAHASGRHFDLAHQPVPVALRFPSPLAAAGIPFVLGPVGGSLESPPGLVEQDTAPWYVRLRQLDSFRLRHDPVLRRTYESADAVIGIAPYVAEHLTSLRLKRFVAVSDVALEALPPVVDRSAARSPVRLLFVGRLIRTKGVRDAVRALAQLRDLPLVLDVVGDGFDRAATEALVEELGLEGQVVFHGNQPRERVEDFYRRADVFVFPSFREPGGTVVFEAMGQGLPLVVADRGGPTASVSSECAFRISTDDAHEFVNGIAGAVRRLVEDPSLRRRMGEAARQHVERTGTWDRRVEQMETIYSEVVGRPV